MRSRALIGAFALLLLLGCDSSSVEQRLEKARAAIVQRNFGEAAQEARAAVRQAPDDPDAHYELARAEALLSNYGGALQALESAITRGLGNSDAALSDPAFDRLADNDRFIALREQAAPGSARPTAALRGVSPSTRAISAGSGDDRVEIREADGRTVITVGDIELDTDF